MTHDRLMLNYRSRAPFEQAVFLEGRKGLARLALRTGTPILPALSIGHTAVFGAWCG